MQKEKTHKPLNPIPEESQIKNRIDIEAEMFYSDAYRVLSPSAKDTLLRCLQKRKFEFKRVNKRNKKVYLDTPFKFPYAEAEALGIAKGTQHWANMMQLIELGWLILSHQGGRYQKNEKEKDCSLYQYSERWKKFSANPEVRAASGFIPSKKEPILRPEHYVRVQMEHKKQNQLHRCEHDNFTSVKPTTSQT